MKKNKMDLEREIISIKALIGLIGLVLNLGFVGLFGFIAYETISIFPIILFMFHVAISIFLYKEINKIVSDLKNG